MQVLGPIDADPDIDPLFGKKCAPAFIDQCSVRLERMHYPQVGGLQPIDRSERIAVEGHRQNHRFAGMPHYRQAVPDPARREHLREKIVEGLLSDDSLGASIRKVTIFAIDVTERGRLDDQQLYLGHRAAPTPCWLTFTSYATNCSIGSGGRCANCSRANPNADAVPNPSSPIDYPRRPGGLCSPPLSRSRIWPRRTRPREWRQAVRRLGPHPRPEVASPSDRPWRRLALPGATTMRPPPRPG